MWMWHKPCRTFHPWCPCIKTRCLLVPLYAALHDLSSLSPTFLCKDIHRSPRWIPHTKAMWRVGLMFSLICAWISGWVNNGEAGDLRRHGAHYDVPVMVRKCLFMRTYMINHDDYIICTIHTRALWEVTFMPDLQLSLNQIVISLI